MDCSTDVMECKFCARSSGSNCGFGSVLCGHIIRKKVFSMDYEKDKIVQYGK